MKIYLAYKLSDRNLEEVKERLLEIDKVVKKLGHETFIFVRDIQKWKPNGEPKQIMEKAMENMRKCDAILSIIETQEKGEGLLLESGYMKALGKKVIVASKPEGRAVLLKGMADEVFEFNNMKEFEEKSRRILKCKQ